MQKPSLLSLILTYFSKKKGFPRTQNIPDHQTGIFHDLAYKSVTSSSLIKGIMCVNGHQNSFPLCPESIHLPAVGGIIESRHWRNSAGTQAPHPAVTAELGAAHTSACPAEQPWAPVVQSIVSLPFLDITPGYLDIFPKHFSIRRKHREKGG